MWSASLTTWVELLLHGSGESSSSCMLVLGLTSVVVATGVMISEVTSWWMWSSTGSSWAAVAASWTSPMLAMEAT